MDSKMPIHLQHEGMEWKGGVCLTVADFEELYSQRDLFLHPKEKMALGDFTHLKRQESYLLGRYCAKQAIATQGYDGTLSDILIEGGVFQQPIIYHALCNNLQVSISHSDAFGAALVFPEAHPMAIDVETLSLDNLAAIKGEMTDAELKLAPFRSQSEIKFLTVLWTAKEALAKVLKCGFTIPLDLLEVAELLYQGKYVSISFKNFFQYQALAFEINNAICSIVYPKKTKMSLKL